MQANGTIYAGEVAWNTRDGEHVEIELMMGPTGAPWHVLRCSMRPECPPMCDQACRNLAEAVIGPARALLILPPGEDVPELLD